MSAYRVTQHYQSGLGAFRKGEIVELVDDFAAHINRDAPGTLEPYLEPEPESGTRADDAPPHDRMVKTARRRNA